MTDLVETATGVFSEDAFQHLLTRETRRAARYKDFFSLCLVKPDLAPASDDLDVAVSQKISEFVRSTDLVGRLRSGIAIVLICTSGEAAIGVANRIRAHIGQVTFKDGPTGGSHRLTVSIGEVSCPRHGHDHQTLLAMAAKCLGHAAERGGDRVVYASELGPRGGSAGDEGAAA